MHTCILPSTPPFSPFPSCYPTDHFTISVPQNPTISVSEQHNIIFSPRISRLSNRKIVRSGPSWPLTQGKLRLTNTQTDGQTDRQTQRLLPHLCWNCIISSKQVRKSIKPASQPRDVSAFYFKLACWPENGDDKQQSLTSLACTWQYSTTYSTCIWHIWNNRT